MSDLYIILEITRGATPQQIKAAWQSKRSKHHPDRNNGDPISADLFAAAKEAFDVLIDPMQRRIYDADGVVNDDPLFLDAVKKIAEAIVNIIDTTEDVGGHDLLAGLQNNITNYIKNIGVTKNQVIATRQKFEKVKEKFIKRQRGFNIFAESIKVEIFRLDKDLDDLQHKIDIAEKMYEITKGYNYQQLLNYVNYH